jgi:hypothetical protein
MSGDDAPGPEPRARGEDGTAPASDDADRPSDTSPTPDEAASDPDSDPMTVHPDELDRSFDWRGWALVAAVLVAFLVVPGFIYLYPRMPSSIGLTFWDTYLVLPMIPAIVLGLLAVWATTRP